MKNAFAYVHDVHGANLPWQYDIITPLNLF